MSTCPALTDWSARGISLFLTTVFGAAACGRRPTVVAGAQDITSAPQQITFLGPVPVSGPRRELCFDFDPPQESDKASTLQAVLLTTEGRRDSLVEPTVDRRGEGRVCLVAARPSEEEVARFQGTQYRGVELTSSNPPVHVKTIRWWSGR
jgi:hypothetical protein